MVGRAGLEPATNWLKASGPNAAKVLTWLRFHPVALPQ